MTKYRTHEERIAGFLARAKPDPVTGCWEWQGEIKLNGYTECWVFGRREMAHRAAYRELVGPIPEGKIIRHTCDNPRCCNPAHLLPGTQADNIRDKVARNRQAKGERHGSAKLTEQQVREIRASPISGRKLSPIYGVSQTMIDQIKRRVRWAHVE